jgi:LytS/YehU family sensor histidine kinase
VRDQQLHFAVRNSYSPTAPQHAVGGVDLSNVRKRLALRYAPTNYALNIEQATVTYAVILVLQLTPIAEVPTGATSDPVLALRPGLSPA